MGRIRRLLFLKVDFVAWCRDHFLAVDSSGRTRLTAKTTATQRGKVLQMPPVHLRQRRSGMR